MSKYAELCKCGHARGEHSEGDWACFEEGCQCLHFEYAAPAEGISTNLAELLPGLQYAIRYLRWRGDSSYQAAALERRIAMMEAGKTPFLK